MKAFGKKAQQATPLRQYDEETEAGTFIPETQNQYASLDVASSKNAAQLDEYKG